MMAHLSSNDIFVIFAYENCNLTDKLKQLKTAGMWNLKEEVDFQMVANGCQGSTFFSLIKNSPSNSSYKPIKSVYTSNLALELLVKPKVGLCISVAMATWLLW